VLDGYARFLQDKNVALDKRRPYLVHWVWELLLFAWANAGYAFEQTLKRVLAEVGGRGARPHGPFPWVCDVAVSSVLANVLRAVLA
jgi:hypothetical protein